MAGYGLIAPSGVLTVPDTPQRPDFPYPWVVKAQVPLGGRGKAGGIRVVTSDAEFTEACAALAELSIKGHPVTEVRIEQAVEAAQEVYVGLIVDPVVAGVRVLVSETGGIEVESQGEGALLSHSAPLEEAEMIAALDALVEALPERLQPPVREVGRSMVQAFLGLDATMLEINPLFVRGDGTWAVGDVRLNVDENALIRQPILATLIYSREHAYAEAVFKRRHGYDLVIVDPQGEIGLVATGAGLSMQLVDEMNRRGMSPLNFCDIRSGGMKGDPARLVENFHQILNGPKVRCILVNIFAGITDLGEFAETLVAALRVVGRFDIPIVVRLVGNGADRADRILRDTDLPLLIERDLDRALTLCTKPEVADAAQTD